MTTNNVVNAPFPLSGAQGGTGIANTSKSITLGGNLTTSGAFNSTFTMTAATNVTFPTSGTLATVAGSTSLINVQAFTSTGAFTYTPTAGILYAIVILIGAGGASGGAAATTSSVANGAGGGSGAYAEFLLTSAQIGTSLTGSVGAGGTTGTAGNNPGNNGGNTTLATSAAWTAGGGTGGGGSAANTTVVLSTGGAGGTVTSGTGTIISDIAGQTGFMGVSNGVLWANAGAGGSNPRGFGGISTVLTSGTTAGKSGTGYGSGASGAANIVTQSATAGTAGNNGIAIFLEFCG